MTASVGATETPVTSWTFDDASSPVLDNSTGTGTTADYSHAAVVGNVGSGNNFLNAYRATNGNGELKATITEENLTSAAKWVLEFDFAGFSGCNKNAGQTIIADAEGNAILTITDAADWGSTFALSDGNTIACYVCEKTNRGSANTGNQLSATYWHHFTITGGASGIKMSVSRYNADGSIGNEVISKSQLSSTNATPSSISIKAGSWGSMGIDNLSLVTSDEGDVVYNYTVKYIDIYEEEEIKDAVVRSDEEGAFITLTAADKADFYTADGLTKYIYYGDDSKNKQVSPDGSTVVTVSFIPADIFDYTVNASYGSKTKEITSGTSFDGDAVTVCYPKYIYDEENGALYTSGNYPFQTTFTPDQPGYKQSVTYTLAEEETNVVFYAEAEEIEGVSPFADGNTGIRMSNGAVGEADSVAVATLPAGIYTLTSSSRSGETQFLVEDETILTITSSGSVTDGTSPEFTIKKDGTNVMAKNVLTSGHKNYFDYVLIRKTGDYNYLYIEGELPDSITLEQGETPEIVNEISPKSNATVIVPSALHVAQGSVEGTKETAEYTAIPATASEEDVRAAFAEPGIYYVFASFVGQFADESTQFAYTDTVVVTVTEKKEPVVSAHTWDFTQWSDATITNLKAEAAKEEIEDMGEGKTNVKAENGATWSDHEKAAQTDASKYCTTYAASKDNCFWFFGSANADGQLEANGEVIEELAGLTFPTAAYNSARSIAIAVNYPETSLGTYNGPSYLWLGGKEKDCFVIKNVKRGTNITIGVESHKPAEARGVKLKIGNAELTDPTGTAVAAPTVYAEQTWAVPEVAAAGAKAGALNANADDDVVDVTVYNTNGCHIYFIDAEIGEAKPDAIQNVEAETEAVKAVKFVKNGQLIIVSGGKQFNAAGAQVK